MSQDVSALSALNMRLRDDYVRNCQKGIDRWNRVMTLNDIDFQITLPHVGFHRKIGEFKNSTFDITGTLLTADDWTRRRDTMLPNGDCP